MSCETKTALSINMGAGTSYYGLFCGKSHDSKQKIHVYSSLQDISFARLNCINNHINIGIWKFIVYCLLTYGDYLAG